MNQLKKIHKRNVFNLETTKGYNKIGKKSNNSAAQVAQAKTGITRELRNSSALT